MMRRTPLSVWNGWANSSLVSWAAWYTCRCSYRKRTLLFFKNFWSLPFVLRWNSWTSIKQKRLKLFSLCYSKSLLLADFTEIRILGHQFNKRLESFAHASHSPFNWRILKKPILYSGFNNPDKKHRLKMPFKIPSQETYSYLSLKFQTKFCKARKLESIHY
jgi:hypothetical protein